MVELEDLIYAAPTLEVQFTLAMVQAVIWYVVIAVIAPPIFIPMIKALPETVCVPHPRQQARYRCIAERLPREEPRVL